MCDNFIKEDSSENIFSPEWNRNNNLKYKIMTQEQKELLIKDLCGRLPYGVNIKLYYEDVAGDERVWEVDNAEPFHVNDWEIEHIKPYLRPLSSMTEEEHTEYEDMCDSFRGEEFHELIDWLNKKMLDYRGLIPMGLALEATEDMYNIK